MSYIDQKFCFDKISIDCGLKLKNYVYQLFKFLKIKNLIRLKSFNINNICMYKMYIICVKKSQVTNLKINS